MKSTQKGPGQGGFKTRPSNCAKHHAAVLPYTTAVCVKNKKPSRKESSVFLDSSLRVKIKIDQETD